MSNVFVLPRRRPAQVSSEQPAQARRAFPVQLSLPLADAMSRQPHDLNACAINAADLIYRRNPTDE
jgi:hypothetical protein